MPLVVAPRTLALAGSVSQGGISFFSNRHGWALDNVIAYEIVLADGAIVQASAKENPDLYRAQRGGGLNFGVVTTLTLNVYPCIGMWGGGINWSWEQGDVVIDAFLHYGHTDTDNSDSTCLIGITSVRGKWIWHADLARLEPVAPEAGHALGKFMQISGVITDQTALTSQMSRVEAISSHYPNGAYNGYWIFCTKYGRDILRFFFDTWANEATPVLDVDGFNQSALADVNIVTKNVLARLRANGGNALHLTDDEPFLLYLMEPSWKDGAQSDRVWKAILTTAQRTIAEAESRRVQHSYIYLNYANPLQGVYGGYGNGAKEFLESVSTKNDPEQILQQRTTGWKLHGAITSSEGDL